MDSRQHWQTVYSEKAAEEVSWFQPHARLATRWIQELDVGLDATIIDIGGGDSRFVDDLLALGYRNLSVLDISGNALARARARLGELASPVVWIESNMLEANLKPGSYDLWHDRAVFHFLVDADDREKYVRHMLKTLSPGGLVLMATFADDGPVKCSGLPVQRYSAADLQAELGDEVELLRQEKTVHVTPAGAKQKFVNCAFRQKELS